jgi:hypothetical protein
MEDNVGDAVSSGSAIFTEDVQAYKKASKQTVPIGQYHFILTKINKLLKMKNAEWQKTLPFRIHNSAFSILT